MGLIACSIPLATRRLPLITDHLPGQEEVEERGSAEQSSWREEPRPRQLDEQLVSGLDSGVQVGAALATSHGVPVDALFDPLELAFMPWPAPHDARTGP